MRLTLGPHLLSLERSSRDVDILLELEDRGVPLLKRDPLPSKLFTRKLELRLSLLESGTRLLDVPDLLHGLG
jgi:hypothetical protein